MPPAPKELSAAGTPMPSSYLTTYFVLLVVCMLCSTSLLVFKALGGFATLDTQGTNWLERVTTKFGFVLVMVGFIGTQLALASTGLLEQFDSPPPTIAILLAPVLICTIYFATLSNFAGRIATALSVRTLIGFQVFRFGPEIFLHLGYLEGSLPAQMTFPPEGRNVDVFVAAAALILAAVSSQPPEFFAWAFALLGLASLLNISYTSVRSLAHWLTPPDFQPGLEAMARPPFILLPGFLFQLALCGQLLLLRKLMMQPRSARGGRPAEMW